jgi:hypothetical protein
VFVGERLGAAERIIVLKVCLVKLKVVHLVAVGVRKQVRKQEMLVLQHEWLLA